MNHLRRHHAPGAVSRACRIAIAWLALPLLLLIAGNAVGSVVVRLSDESLAAKADVIVSGQVVRIQSMWNRERTSIHSYITVSVEEHLAGGLGVGEITFRELGGQVGGTRAWINGAPSFRTGEDVLLFLSRGKDGVLHTTGLFQGKFSLIWDAVRGSRRAQRDFSHAGTVVLGEKLGPVKEDREYSAFRERIQALTAERGKGKARGVVTLPAEVTGRASEAQNIAAFELFGVAWDNSDFPIGFKFSSTTQLGAPGGGIPETEAGMAAWSAIPGSAASMFNAGLSSPRRILLCDGRNTINFNDPFDELPDDGTLALGGGCADDSGRFVEGDITFNDDFLSVSIFAEPGCFQATATHELGHTLGLGHSSDPNALMFPFISDDKCASPFPRSDDIAGVQFLYGSSGPPVGPLAAPTGVSASAIGNQVTIEFNAVEGATSYDVVALGVCDPCATVPGSPVVAGGVPDGNYAIGIRARNGSVTSELSEIVALQVNTGAPGQSSPLAAPGNFRAFVFGGNNLAVLFEEVPGAESYDIVVLGLCDPCGSIGTNAAVFPGVPTGIYTLGARARVGATVSALSNTVTVIIP
jgi:hypothetical protein